MDYLFLQEPIEELLWYLHKTYEAPLPSIDIDRDISEITSGFLRMQKDNSLARCYPEVAKELHPTKNKSLDPSRIGCRSGQMVWWKCPICGYEWKSRIIDRTTKGQGCKECGNRQGAIKRISKKLATGGSFANHYPKLLEEWDYTKNNGISPYEYTVSSSKKVWWKCIECGHEWQARIAERTKAGQGCQRCGYHKAQQNKIQSIIADNGSLADNYPEIAAEWDYERNAPLLPSEVTFASNKKVWWKCRTCGNVWQTRISQRTRGQGCPQCYKEGTVENQIMMYGILNNGNKDNGGNK